MKSFRLVRAASIAIAMAVPSLAPLSSWAQDPSSTSTAAALAARLQLFVDNHELAGAVLLVADKDKVLDAEAVGFADIAANKPMQTDSLFWIASMSKPITAAALMLLVDDGKVKLDDPVAKYLPEFNDLWLAAFRDDATVLLKRPKQPINLRHILSHTSGLPFRSSVEQPTLDMLPLADAARSYALTPLNFEPGSKWDYSNAGINTAGRIIEVVSGQKYEDFLQQRLLDPLGMKDTTFWPTEQQLARLAKAYKPGANNRGLEEITISQLHYPLSDRKRQPMPAGGLFSTAGDCAAFGRMLLAGGLFDGKRVLSEDAVKQMAANQTGELPNGYGLGCSTDRQPNGTFGHGGALATDLKIDRTKQLVLVWLVQHAGYPGDGGKAHGSFVNAATEKFGK